MIDRLPRSLCLGMACLVLGVALTPAPARPEASWSPAPTSPRREDVPGILVRLRAAPTSVEPRVQAVLEKTGSRAAISAIDAPFIELLAGDPLGADGADEALRRIRRLTPAPGVDAAAVARLLAEEPGIEAAWVEASYGLAWIDASRILRPGSEPSLFPDDPLFRDGSQWGLENTGAGPFGAVAGVDIRMLEGWRTTTGSTSTILGIVDTGIDPGHPELGGQLADGSPRIAAMYNSSVEPAGASAYDSVGHGTMVAGVALARTNNGPVLDGRGVAGVAGGAGGDSAGCRVIAVKATPTRYTDALSSELAEGIVYAVLHGARAINLSFAGDDDDDLLLDAISFASRRGCVVVCGAGNGQDSRPQYPGYYARYGNGLSIAALRSDGTLALFSTRGPQIDVAAPGQDIYSTYLTYENAYQGSTRNFEYTSGTSFAAPFVTGLAGLVATLQPSLADNEFQQLLRHTARDVGAPGRDDTYGWGIPDAGALLSYVAPPRGFLRGVARAQQWTLLGSDSITLSRTRLELGDCRLDGRYRAERWEVRTRVDLPPGRFLETPLAFVRTHATRGWTAGPVIEYGLGSGEVVTGSASPTGFTLRTYVYRIDAGPYACIPSPGPVGFVPVPPESVSFAWSAFGLLTKPPSIRITEPATDGAAWSVDVPDTLRWELSDADAATAIEIAVSGNSGATWQRVALLPGTPLGAFPLRAVCGVGDGRSRVRVSASYPGVEGSDESSDVRTLHPSRACLPGENPAGPDRLTLLPVAPDPARGSAILRYAFGERAPSDPEITIHDARGRRLRAFRLAWDGATILTWDGRDDAGRRVSSGVYFARLRAAGQAVTRRFVFLADSAP